MNEENCVRDGVVRKWCWKFKDVHDEGDKDVSLLEKEDIMHQVDEMVKENCSGLYVKVPKVSRSFLYSVVTKHLDYTVENFMPTGYQNNWLTTI